MNLKSWVKERLIQFVSWPTGRQLRHTIFYCFLILTFILGCAAQVTARFGILRETPLSLYYQTSKALRHAIEVTGGLSLIGLLLSWVMCHEFWHGHWILKLCILLCVLLQLTVGY